MEKTNQNVKRRYLGARYTHQRCGKSPSRAMDVHPLEAHGKILAEFDP